jgi:hypothetical protein
MIRILFALILFFSFISNSTAQSLVYKSNGNVYNTEGKRLSPTRVREILSIDNKDLDLYNEGRDKKTAGNFLLLGGLTLLAGDLIRGLSTDTKFPGGLTFVGIGAIVVAIPVKIGFSKKIKTAVDSFNKLYPNGNTASISNDNELEFVASANGFGFRLTLN